MTYKINKNDIAWEKIFSDLNILEEIKSNGCFIIKSDEINRYREARLMTKFDHAEQLPKIFTDNQLALLPITRGSYCIANMEIFDSLSDNKVEIQSFPAPLMYESIDYNNLTSEAAVINCAYVSEIIQDFIGEQEIKPTVSGRMGSSSFEFQILNSDNNTISIKVNNAQIEIDGGFEGEFSLCIVEAKNYISDTFVIRQLFYPYKLWSKKINKPVRPIFLSYTNGIFHFREYKFENSQQYNSIKLIREKKYILEDRLLTLETIQEILYDSKEYSKEPNVPLPQADNLERLINFCELLYSKNQDQDFTTQKITELYGFDSRQTDYYYNAGRYLGLIEKQRTSGGAITFELTDKGKNIFQLPLSHRNLELIKLILSFQIFNESLKIYFESGSSPNKAQLVQIIQETPLARKINKTTMERRASTVRGWLDWIFESVEQT